MIGITITKNNGKWFVNEKPINELNSFELNFLNEFFKEMKLKDNQILI